MSFTSRCCSTCTSCPLTRFRSTLRGGGGEEGEGEGGEAGGGEEGEAGGGEEGGGG